MQSGCDPNVVCSASLEEAREPRTRNDCQRGRETLIGLASRESLHNQTTVRCDNIK